MSIFKKHLGGMRRPDDANSCFECLFGKTATRWLLSNPQEEKIAKGA
jgi:hypothetical protein